MIQRTPKTTDIDVFRNSMETKYLGYRFSSVKITASCLWIWFAGIHLWIQQTKHLQCTPYTQFLTRPARKESNIPKLKNSYYLRAYCSNIYTVLKGHVIKNYPGFPFTYALCIWYVTCGNLFQIVTMPFMVLERMELLQVQNGPNGCI